MIIILPLYLWFSRSYWYDSHTFASWPSELWGDRLVRKHLDRFHLPYDKLEATTAAEHYIPTTDKIPIHTKQYRFPPAHKEEINRQINDLLNNQLIENSTSPYNSPLWIVPKKPDLGNKRWRLVIDYRTLNQKTIGDAYPLPNITDILDQLGSAKYFSVLDLASGLHQIPMAKEDASKTAFSTPHRHYQFLRMPFDLKNAPFPTPYGHMFHPGYRVTNSLSIWTTIVIYAKSLSEHEIKFNRPDFALLIWPCNPTNANFCGPRSHI